MNDEKYTVMLDCGNCGAPNTVSIPKGTSVRKFVTYDRGPTLNFDAPVCFNCGCQAIDSTSPSPILHG